MERLKNELTSLVYEYSKNKKYADKKFVDKAIELCINTLEINDYVKEYKHIDYYMVAGADAVYDISTRGVLINTNGLVEASLEKIKDDEKNGYTSSEFNHYAKVNLFVINAIVHELTHACQYRRYIEGNKDLENKILGLSLERNIDVLNNNYISPQKVFYYKTLDRKFKEEIYYKAVPTERMAILKGLEFENDISRLLDTEDKFELEAFTNIRLLYCTIEGYKGCSPTGFVTCVNDTLKAQFGLSYNSPDIDKIENRYEELAKENNLDIQERLRLGLPVEEQELQKIKTKIEVAKCFLK